MQSNRPAKRIKRTDAPYQSNNISTENAPYRADVQGPVLTPISTLQFPIPVKDLSPTTTFTSIDMVNSSTGLNKEIILDDQEFAPPHISFTDNQILLTVNCPSVSLDEDKIVETQFVNNSKKNSSKISSKFKKRPSLAEIHQVVLENPQINSDEISKLLNTTRRTLATWLATKIYDFSPLTITKLRKISKEEAIMRWGKEDYEEPIQKFNFVYEPNGVVDVDGIRQYQIRQQQERIQTPLSLTSLEKNSAVSSLSTYMVNPTFADFSPLSDEASNQQDSAEEFSTQFSSISTSQQNEDSVNAILSQLDDVVKKIIPELSEEKVKQHSQYFLNYLYQQKEEIDQTAEKLQRLTGKLPTFQRSMNVTPTLYDKNRFFSQVQVNHQSSRNALEDDINQDKENVSRTNFLQKTLSS